MRGAEPKLRASRLVPITLTRPFTDKSVLLLLSSLAPRTVPHSAMDKNVVSNRFIFQLSSRNREGLDGRGGGVGRALGVGVGRGVTLGITVGVGVPPGSPPFAVKTIVPLSPTAIPRNASL